MAKDYNIDDILSEVKKRREDNEEKIKAGESFTAETEKKGKNEPAQESTVDEYELTQEIVVDEADEKAVVEETVEEGAVDEEAVKEDDVKEESDTDDFAFAKEVEEDNALQEEAVSDANAQDGTENLADFIDMNTMSLQKETVDEYIEQEPKKETKKKKKKRKKGFITVLCILLAVLIALGVGGYLYIDKILDKITPDNEQTQTVEEKWTGMDTLVESFEPIEETDASQISSLKDMIKQWFFNGKPCSSSHVLNIMLVGEDTRKTDVETRADSAILCSVNIDTQKITLTSVLRDTYGYWLTEAGNKETGQFGKINGAKSTGGIESYIEAVESLYKIKIDNYVTVNFDSFETIVDTLGGVDIEITSAEINEINNHPKVYGNVVIEKNFDGNEGTMKLDGKQALAYCRIRHIDSDNARADRQKKCLNQMFKQVKGLSGVNLLKLLNKLTPYIKTDMSRDTIVKVAKYAISKGWMNFKIENNTVPESRINESAAGGNYYGAWCWKADFPQDAYNLQMKLYGKSSITLARTRVDVLKCQEYGFYADGDAPVWATITNDHYGEVTTLPVEETEEKTSE